MLGRNLEVGSPAGVGIHAAGNSRGVTFSQLWPYAAVVKESFGSILKTSSFSASNVSAGAGAIGALADAGGIEGLNLSSNRGAVLRELSGLVA